MRKFILIAFCLGSILAEHQSSNVKVEQFKKAFSGIYSNEIDVEEDDFICNILFEVVQYILEYIRIDNNVEDLAFYFNLACESYGTDYKTCRGFFDLNVDTFLYIIKEKPGIDARRICELAQHEWYCPSGDFRWEVDIPGGFSKERNKTNENAGSFNIVHISDIHYDPLYTPGKVSTCSAPLCCQADQEDAGEGSEPCGYWSSNNLADTPLHTIEAVFTQVNKHDISYIYFTGNIISHRSWSTSIENNTRDIKLLYGKFKEFFDVPVYPILGNHESSPLNLFSINVSDSSNLTTNWLYNLVAEEWSDWLPEDTQETIKQGGFYTVSPRPGFRVIALNSNVCFTMNWWLLWSDVDPYGQLAWLVKVLTEAENNDESVHILTHIPPGENVCLIPWSKNFNKIVTRFSNTITGIFTGHTHKDEWQVFYNQSHPNRPINVAFNGASVTPYVASKTGLMQVYNETFNSNPSYKIIEVTNDTFNVNNIYEWTFNLTAANMNPDVRPEWYQLYSFKDAYELSSMEAVDVNDLLYRMAANQTLIKQFYKFQNRNSDVANSKECSIACQREILCVASTTTFYETTKCEELWKIWNDNFN